jgi:hypothetical protein
MVYSTSELQSFWTLSIGQYSKKLKNTTFHKLDLRTETDPVSETLLFNFLEYWTMDKVQKLSNSECIFICYLEEI